MNQTLQLPATLETKRVSSVMQYEHNQQLYSFVYDLGDRLDSEKFLRTMKWAALHGVTVVISSSLTL